MRKKKMVRKMKIEKILEGLVGGALIASGGVSFMATTIPGAALVMDAFGVLE